MMVARDPVDMTPEERIKEVAFLMATAYLRLLVFREKELELSAPVEAPCAHVADTGESIDGKEKP